MHREESNVLDSLKLRLKLLKRTRTYVKVIEFVKKDAIRYYKYIIQDIKYYEHIHR